MSEWQHIPESLSTAVVGAAIDAVGFVAKIFIEWIGALRDDRTKKRARLVELQSLLRASLTSFRIQKDHVERLARLVKK